MDKEQLKLRLRGASCATCKYYTARHPRGYIISLDEINENTVRFCALRTDMGGNPTERSLVDSNYVCSEYWER